MHHMHHMRSYLKISKKVERLLAHVGGKHMHQEPVDTSHDICIETFRYS